MQFGPPLHSRSLSSSAMRTTTAIFFFGALVVSGFVQGVLLLHVTLLDEDVWLERIANFTSDIHQQPMAFEQRYYGGQPGMSLISVAGLLHASGVASRQSLVAVLVAFNAMMLAAIFTLLYHLRPTTYWWLAGGILLLHPFYWRSTPTNLLMAPLAVVLFLLALKIYESRPKSIGPYLALGTCIGFGLTNRFIDTLFFALGIAIFLLPLKRKHVGLVVGSALVAAGIFDPLLLTQPIAHIQFMVGRVAVHYATLPGTPLSLAAIGLLSPFMPIAIVFSLLYLFFSRRVPTPISKKLLVILLIMSGIMIGSTLTATAASGRYLYPIISLWEVFLPLLLLQLGLHSQFLKNARQRPLQLMGVITLLVIGGQLLLIGINL